MSNENVGRPTRSVHRAGALALVIGGLFVLAGGCGGSVAADEEPPPERVCRWQFARVSYEGGKTTRSDERIIECAEDARCPIDGCNDCACTFDSAGRESRRCSSLPPC